jgi:hypothetical protein
MTVRITNRMHFIDKDTGNYRSIRIILNQQESFFLEIS